MIRSSSSYAGENCLRLYNSWVVDSGVRVICRVLLLTYLYRMESKSLLGYPLLMKVCFILFMVVSNIDQLEKNYRYGTWMRGVTGYPVFVGFWYTEVM